MNPQCKTCPLTEKVCRYKKHGNRHFDGVYNICMHDPREKAKKAMEEHRERQKELQKWHPRNGGSTL